MFSFSGGLLISCVFQGRKLKINFRSRGVRHTKNQHPLIGKQIQKFMCSSVHFPHPWLLLSNLPQTQICNFCSLFVSPLDSPRGLLETWWVGTYWPDQLSCETSREGGASTSNILPPPQQKIPTDRVCSSAPWQVCNACRRKGFGSITQCAEWCL